AAAVVVDATAAEAMAVTAAVVVVGGTDVSATDLHGFRTIEQRKELRSKVAALFLRDLERGREVKVPTLKSQRTRF
ncbi:MAG: hypothetical protein WAM79_00180, partial [Candidatus Sulfotelmatobacter sp.]